MSLTRRDVLTGAAIAAAGGVVVGERSSEATAALACGGQPQPAPVLSAARVPTDAELEAWELAYKISYRTQHQARNEALERLGELEATPLRVDKALAVIETEQAAAFSLVDEGLHKAIASARAQGFGARRDGKPATANPHPESGPAPLSQHLFMSWYAGWVQGDPNLKLPRTRGYTPPAPAAVPVKKPGQTFT